MDPQKHPYFRIFIGKLYLSISEIHQWLLIVLEMAFFLESLSVLQRYEANIFWEEGPHNMIDGQ